MTVQSRKDVSLGIIRDKITFWLMECKCCGGMITCKLDGYTITWYCDDPDPEKRCEHVSENFECDLGGECHLKDGGKLRDDDAMVKRRMLINFAAYEIIRCLCQHDYCVASHADEISRALTEIHQMLDIMAYTDGNVFYISPTGGKNAGFLEGLERDGKVEKVSWDD